jgi:hypothetical protein
LRFRVRGRRVYRDSFHFSPPPAVKYKRPLRQAANITEVKIHLLPPPVCVQFLQDVGSVKELVGVELAFMAASWGPISWGPSPWGGLLLGGPLPRRFPSARVRRTLYGAPSAEEQWRVKL